MMTQDAKLNDNMLLNSLGTLEEQHHQALLRIKNYQQLADRYYNKKVRNRYSDEGDLVLRKVYENTEEENVRKLDANWEGPYQISKIVKPGIYELMEMDGTQVPRS